MMKNIKELGLQLIELKDQVLLVDKKSKNGKLYLVDNSLGKKTESAEIIASTKPLEGLPLLVIEDEVEKLAYEAELEDTKDCDPFDQYYGGDDFNRGFQQGYNKAKETYKFTEEDLCKFVEWMNLHYRTLEHTISFKGVEGTKELLALWLWETKKELYVEVELKETKSSVFSENDNAPFSKYQIKIKDNKIKAVWK